jgi:hypothetical protein
MPLFYSNIKPFSENQQSETFENSSFLPSSNVYERVRSEIPSNPVYNYNKITSRLDNLEKLMNKIYTSNIDNKELRTSFFPEFNLGDSENNFESTSTNRLLSDIKKYLFYILVALSFILIRLYKINLSIIS